MVEQPVEDQYTKVPDAALESFARTRVPGEVMQMVMTIMRKTWGFNKTADWISLSQFSEATGIDKPHVVRALNKAVDMNIVAKKGNGENVTYCVNTNYASWRPLPKKVTVAKKGNDSCPKRQSSLPKKAPTKDTLTKDITTKDNTPEKGDHRKVILYFDEKHQQKFGFPYPMVGGRDGKLVKGLLTRWKTAENLFILIDELFDSSDRWLQTKKTIPILSRFDAQLAQAARERIRKDEPDWEFIRSIENG